MGARAVLTCLIYMIIFTSAFGATFNGIVIDADTKLPIEGAVVVASWSEERATPAGPTSRSKDVKETLTDKNGMWRINGPKGGEVGNIKAIFSFLTGTYFTNPPEFIVFKPGYCSWPAGFGINSCKEKIKPVGSNKIAAGVTVELPRLIARDRETTLRNRSFISFEDDDKIPNYKRLLEQDKVKR